MKNLTGSLRMTILLLCLLAGLPGLSLAQDRGGITGTVSDPSGAGIPDASVKVTNIGRGEAIELRSTTGAGTLAFDDSAIGPISIITSGNWVVS